MPCRGGRDGPQKQRGPGQGPAREIANNNGTGTLAQWREARNRMFDELDAVLAELFEAEAEADALGGLCGVVRPEQRPASSRIDRAHAVLDALEAA